MFASSKQLLTSPVRFIGRFARGHVKSCLIGAVVLLAVASAAGWHAWRHWQQWAAWRDFQLDLLVAAYAEQEAYLEREPDDYEAQLLAARMTRLLGNFPQAEKHLGECMRLRGGSEETQLQFLLLRAQGGDLASVEAALHQFVEKKHHYVVVLEGLTQTYMKELRFTAAAFCLDRWLEAEPNNIRALNWRGFVRENLDFGQDAMDDYRRVLQMSPKHGTARLRLVNLLLATSQVPDADAHLQILERVAPDNPQVLLALAQCRSLQGRDQDAVAYLDKLLSTHPNNARALYQRSKFESNPVAKEKWIRRSLDADPSFHDAIYALYTALNQQPGKQAEAAIQLKVYQQTLKDWQGLRDVMRSLERSPNNPDLLAKVGSVILPRDTETGMSFLHKALAAAPNHRLANETMMRYFTDKNEPEKAEMHRKRLSP